MEFLYPAIVGITVFITLILVIQKKLPWLICLLILGTLFLAEFKLESLTRADHNKELELRTSQQLNSTTSRLLGSINSNISLIHGLAAHIASQPDIQQADFERFAKAIFRQDPMLINLAAAPDMVIRMIYPIEGNEQALGLNYMTNDKQRDAALKAKKLGKMVVAGPVDLAQGGAAFIGRTPVFLDDSRSQKDFWGIVSAPIDAQMLYQSAGLLNPSSEIEIAIRGADGLGEQGAVFFGDANLFTDPKALKVTIPVGFGSWQMAGRPKAGWDQTPDQIWVMRGITILLALLGLSLLRGRYQQIQNNRQVANTLRENKQLLEDAGQLAQIGGWKLHVNGELSHLSSQSARTFGLPETDTPPSLEDILDLFPANQASQLKYLLQEAVTSGRKFDTELNIEESEGKRWLRLIGNPVHENGHIIEVVGAVQDITERKNFTEMIQRQATYDTITGLPNRFLFENRLSKALAKAHRDQEKLALLFIDLDKFKSVNDNLGHKAGDLLLTEVGSRIKSCTRDSDTVARYSGDEFTVILPEVHDGADAYAVASQILQQVGKPYEILSHQLFCSASIGIAVYPDDGASTEELVTNADQAMYEVKKSGRNGCLYFTQEMQQLSEGRHKLHNRLSYAIANEELDVHFQPIISLENESHLKCEALVRWIDNGEFIPPDDFISLAEESGMINEIDRMVLKKASIYLRSINRAGVEAPGLSVNVSPRVFSSRDNSLEKWLELVTEVAKDLSVTVEITERLITQNTSQASEVLKELSKAGVAIAIDDFGTGYSSLSYLTQFPIDVIKIDRAFVGSIESDKSAATLTDTIISLGKKLNIEVVAEGVETEQQLQFLRERGCHFAQGYHIGKPQDTENFTRWLMAYRGKVVSESSL